jgi:hypothetical protein
MIKLYEINVRCMFKYYTPQQANKALPDVKRKFSLILSVRDQIVQMQEGLQRMIDSNAKLDLYMEEKQKLNMAVSNLYKAIEDIESMGIMIKSVDEGLLDFPSMRFNEEVWLCWKAGEDEVKFWHGKDEGFAGRKPLPISDESLV